MRRNYHRKLRGEIITGKYEEKLSQKIISQYISSRKKMWELQEYWRIQKLSQSAKERTVVSPSLLEGNGLRTAHIMWGNHQGKGWLKKRKREEERERERKYREAQSESKRRRGEERDSEDKIPFEILR